MSGGEGVRGHDFLTFLAPLFSQKVFRTSAHFSPHSSLVYVYVYVFACIFLLLLLVFAAMDPLILIIEEIDRMRRDIDKLDSDLADCELRIDFRPDDARYARLTTEKGLVLNNLCEIRKELCMKGELLIYFSYFQTAIDCCFGLMSAMNMQGNAIYAKRNEGKSAGLIPYLSHCS